jgi:3-deoxy-7-phosphoheptulonate synthase
MENMPNPTVLTIYTRDVIYENQAELASVLHKLETLPPLVSSTEIDKLRVYLAEVAENKRFLIQGGDCAELFNYCSQDPIENKLKVLMQMSLILVWGARTPIVRIARMAGQYAKPRSSPTENINGQTYNSFRGDNVNGMPLDERKPDPQRLLGAYFHSAATMNYVRTLINSEFADLHHPENWNLDHVQNVDVKKAYQKIVDQLLDTLDFMNTIGAAGDHALKQVELFMSHEGLLLDYEQRLTRMCGDKHYNLGTHYLWIGDRTRQLTGAHVEYFRGIQNPIGVKVGPSMKPEELAPLLDILNPDFHVGKVTLITRYGAKKIREYLPAHIKAVQATKHKVVWCCDPMHGNTESTASGFKTRRFENIVDELVSAFEIHIGCGSMLGGAHLELTGDAVTEAIGGSMNLSEADLQRNYQTHCDPRLNYEQSLDVAFKIAEYFRKNE